MTWHNVPRIRAVTLSVGACLAALAPACGSSSKSASIEITAPEKDEVLTSQQDLAKPFPQGLQYTVTAQASGIAADTEMYLQVEGSSQAEIAKVDSKGLITFESVTLPAGTHALTVSTKSDSVRSAAEYNYTYKSIVIDTPADRALLGKMDDEDKPADGIQIMVGISTFAVDLSEDVKLLVDGRQVGDALKELDADANGDGQGEFHITLSDGPHTLQAVAGSAESDISEVTVNSSCATATFVAPAAPDSGETLVLGGSGECPASGELFKTDFRVSTDVGDGRDVELWINDNMVATATVKGSIVEFKDVEFDDSSNNVYVKLPAAAGAECPTVAFPATIEVDCNGVDCSITVPKAVAGRDASGAQVQYLNGSQLGTDGFDFTVTTDAASLGKPIKLIVDGNESDAPSADTTGAGSNVNARFTGVKLSEGTHTVQALCEHADSGASGRSRKFNWVVDTKACGVAITAPVADAVLVSQQDTLPSELDGTQISAESNVTGDDCVMTRSAPCNPSSGISAFAFHAYDGDSPLKSTITLSDDPAQTLCVEVQDRAGNVGRGSVAVSYRVTAPTLEIASPATNTKFNMNGGDGYTADSQKTETNNVCNAEFVVGCSELGVEVQLHRDNDTGAVFARATCETGSNTPDGYNGRAVFANAAFLANNAKTTKVVATQSVGPEDAALVGKSAEITLEGDCTPPALAFTSDFCTSDEKQISVATAATVATSEVTLIDPQQEAMTAYLSVSGNSVDVTDVPATLTGATYTFPNVGFGLPGSFMGDHVVTLTAKSTDAFENVATKTCMVKIVYGVPELTIDQPTDRLVLKPPTTAAPWCDAAGVPGVAVSGSADADGATRQITAAVQGVTPAYPVVDLTLTGTAITGCVAIPNGTHEIVFTLTNRSSGATAIERRTITAATTLLTSQVVLGTVTAAATRTGSASINWTWSEPISSGAEFTGYQLRCNPASIAGGAPDADKETWWTNARTVALTPSDVKPPTSQATAKLRFGEKTNCVMRASDSAGQLTTIGDSKEVNIPFRSVTVNGNGMMSIGHDLTPIGDVNGDGFNDVLIGGWGESYLVFGRTDLSTITAPDVVIQGESASYFGDQVAGLGDFNGDGINDFAITDPFWSPAPGTYAQAGRVYVFYGHAAGESWPATIAAGGTCGADVCFSNATNGERFGASIGSAGNFDNDSLGTSDIVVGSPYYPSIADPVGRVYVLRGREYGTGRVVGGFGRVEVALASAQAFVVQGAASAASPAALDTLFLGQGVAGLGDFDGGNSGSDLVVTSTGCRGDCASYGGRAGTVTMDGKAFFVSGRAYTQTVGTLQTIPMTDPGVRIVDQGPGATYGLAAFAPGNAYDLTGSSRPNAPDVAIWRGTLPGFYLYPGDNNFTSAASNVIEFSLSATSANNVVVGNGSDDVGATLVGGGRRGDVDVDGRTDLLMSVDIGTTNPVTTGPVYLWFHDTFASVLGTTGLAGANSATVLASNTVTDATGRTVEFLGDLNNDGAPEIGIGVPNANGYRGDQINFGNGQWTILY